MAWELSMYPGDAREGKKGEEKKKGEKKAEVEACICNASLCKHRASGVFSVTCLLSICGYRASCLLGWQHAENSVRRALLAVTGNLTFILLTALAIVNCVMDCRNGILASSLGSRATLSFRPSYILKMSTHLTYPLVQNGPSFFGHFSEIQLYHIINYVFGFRICLVFASRC